jgi:hypothetical protein
MESCIEGNVSGVREALHQGELVDLDMSVTVQREVERGRLTISPPWSLTCCLAFSRSSLEASFASVIFRMLVRCADVVCVGSVR